MERSDHPYAVRLHEQLEELQEMVRELENLQFHHCPVGSVENVHYEKVVRMEARFDDQIKKLPQNFDAAQAPAQADDVAQVPLGGRESSSGRWERDSSEPPWVDRGQPGENDPEGGR